MAKRITAKSTKAQIMEAYEALEKERKDLAAKLLQTERSLQRSQSELGKAKSAPVKEKTVVKVVNEAVKVDNVEGILQTFEGIEEGLGKAVSGISNKLTVEADALAKINKSIQEKQAHLEKLYEIKAENGILDELIDEYESSQEKFDKEYLEKKEEFEEELAEKQQEWQKELSRHEQNQEERVEDSEKAQERNEDEYEYDFEQQRDLDSDQLSEQKKSQQQELDDLREVKENAWSETEKALAEREKEFEEYKSKFEELPEKLEKEVKKAEAEGKGIIERDAKVKADLLSKEQESQKRVFELRIKSLENIVKNQQNNLNILNQQLEATYKQAQDLAVKAMEGASSNEKYQTLKEIALEQAKNQSKSK